MFHTDRLQFRKYTMDDLPFYASLWGDEKVMRYIGNGTLKTFMQCKKVWRRGYFQIIKMVSVYL